MHGMLMEWCSDWYENPYNRGSPTDPQGPDTGLYRIVRGGAYDSYSNTLPVGGTRRLRSLQFEQTVRLPRCGYDDRLMR